MKRPELIHQLATMTRFGGGYALDAAVLGLFGIQVERLPKAGWRRWYADSCRWGAVPRVTHDLTETVRLVESQLPGRAWLLGLGRQRPNEPPYGAVIHLAMTSESGTLGEGEAETATGALLIALINAMPEVRQ